MDTEILESELGIFVECIRDFWSNLGILNIGLGMLNTLIRVFF